MDWPTGRFKVILADPPWSYRVYNRASGPVTKGRAGNRGIAERHYDSLSLSELAQLPVPGLAQHNAALFLWATMPLLPEALSLMDAWGFTYKTVAFTWVKTNADGRSVTGRLGHYTRGASELCLLGLRGTMSRKDTCVEQVMLSPRRTHSQKPDEQYERIMRLFGGPYLELFARARYPDWTAWGNEVPEECAS